jgi:RNA polymerase sigma-70 factor (ECF subfamily)
VSDQEIIDGFLAGKKASHTLIMEWVNAVVRYLAQHHRLSADDIVGDTIEKLLRLFRDGSFKKESSLKTYVQRITKYTIIDAVRRPAVCKMDSLAPDFDLAADDNPERISEEEEEKSIYLRMLERISKGCRDLWKKVFADQMPYKEIATQLGISESAVKVRVFRCKEEATRIVAGLK